MAASSNIIGQIHAFWFGPLNEAGICIEDRNALWFGADPNTDETCRNRFGMWLDKARSGELSHWAQTDAGLVALVVLLDQFSRNIHRGTPEAFAGDLLALEVAQQAILAGRTQQMPSIHQVFLLMPLEHCEDIHVQDECVERFTMLAQSMQLPQFESFARFAIAHRDVIARFGRFPHRNAILGRLSNEEESNYLATHGGF